MKMRGIMAVATLAAGSLTMAASADLLAYWSFNDFDTGATSAAADEGSGTLDLSGWGGGVSSFTGTSENVFGAYDAGDDLALQGGEDQSGNGTWIDLDFSMTGFSDLVLTFATRGSGTGFDTGEWSWSTDGTSFTGIGGNTASQSSSWAVRTVDLTGVAALTDASSVTLRYTLDGSTSQFGNNRIDNIQLNADAAVPAPGALALLGMAGLIGVRRRRA